MRRGNKIGAIMSYIPFIGMLAIYIMSLYRGVVGIVDDTERAVRIWTDALAICAVIGELGSFLVINRINILLTGRTPNIVDDLFEENGQDFSVRYNGLMVSGFFMTLILVLYIQYLHTQNHLLLSVSMLLAIFWGFGAFVYILAGYLKLKDRKNASIFSELSNPVFLPMIICMIQLVITRKQLVALVRKSILSPESDVYLVAALIIVLCYFLASAFCHFSNIYCLIGCIFAKKDLAKIEKEIEELEGKDRGREENLRRTTKHVDEKAEQVGFLKKVGLVVLFCYVHVQTYIQERLYAGIYLLLFIKFKITKCFHELLYPERIRINGVRFCWIIAVLELLTLDLLLFMYLESDDPCLKFFELLSTVIIIPVLLSWLAELKTKKE